MTRKSPNFSQRESRIEVTGLTHGFSGFTLETWLAGPRRVRTDTAGILTYRDGSNWYGLFLETTRSTAHLRFVLVTTGGLVVDVVTTTTPYTNWSQEWRHVAVSFDGTKAVITLDGEVATTTAATGGANLIPRERGLVFGSYYNKTQRRRFKGRISEVRLWNLVRTPSQIDNGRFCPLSKEDSLDCVGYWPLDEGMGTIANDRTDAQKNGTLYDIPGWLDWNDSASGVFMDDFENALIVKEDSKLIPPTGSDWGHAAKGDQRSLSIANNCSHCDVGITKVATNPAEFTAPPLNQTQVLKPKGTAEDTYNTTLSFTPRKTGVRKSVVTVTTDRPYYEPYTFSYNVQADNAAAPSLKVLNGQTPVNNGDLIAWGALQKGFTRVITLKNTGTSDQRISRIWLDPAGSFTLDPATVNTTVAANGTTTFKLIFNGGRDSRRTRVNIAGDDSGISIFSFDITAQEEAKPKLMILFQNTQPVTNGQHFELGRMVAGRTEVNYFRLIIMNRGVADLRFSARLTDMSGNFIFEWNGGPELPKQVLTDLKLPPGRNGFPIGLGFYPKASAASHVKVEITSNDPDNPNFSFTVNCQGTASRTSEPVKRDGVPGLPRGGNLRLKTTVAPNLTEYITPGGPACMPESFKDVVIGSKRYADVSWRNEGSDFIVLDGQPQLIGADISEFTLGKLNHLTMGSHGGFLFPVSFTPTSAGTKSITIRFNWNGGRTTDFNISAVARY